MRVILPAIIKIIPSQGMEMKLIAANMNSAISTHE